MGEAKRTGTHGGLFGEAAPRAFVKAWLTAPDQQTIALSDRQMGDGTWIVLAELGSVGRESHFAALLTPQQCRGVADLFAEHVENPDMAAIVQPMSDLVVAMRAAANELERLHAMS